MSKRILINRPNHESLWDVVREIKKVETSHPFEDGRLKGFREYLTEQKILTTENGKDSINYQNMSYFLNHETLPIWAKVHDQDVSVNAGMRFQIDFPSGFPKPVNYDWATPLIEPFLKFKPDFLLFYDSDLMHIVERRAYALKYKIGEMFGSATNTAVGGLNGLNKHDTDGKTIYDFTMNGDKCMKGKTGVLVTSYLNEEEVFGFMRAAKNAGGDMIGACAMFSVNNYKPKYAITLENLTQ